MNETQVIEIIRKHLERFFPKVCRNCGRRFATLKDYLLNTEDVGSAVSYDADAGDWNPVQPLGTVSYANCRCGSALALSSSGMPLSQLWSLLNWARIETQKRSVTPRELLNHLCDEIRHQALSEPDRKPA